MIIELEKTINELKKEINEKNRIIKENEKLKVEKEKNEFNLIKENNQLKNELNEKNRIIKENEKLKEEKEKNEFNLLKENNQLKNNISNQFDLVYFNDLSEKEKNDPGNEEFYHTLYATENVLYKLEKIIQKIEGRTPKDLFNKKIKLSTYCQFLKKSIGEEISIENYKIVLTNDINRDKKLLEYFYEIKDKEKYEIVLDRLKNEIKEFNELNLN